MQRFLPTLALLAVGLVLPGLAAAGRADETQTWIANSLQIGLGESWDLKAGYEERSTDVGLAGVFLRNGSLGLFRDTPGNTYVGVAYKRESNERASGTINEDRIILEGGWKRGLRPKLDLDTRLRAEFRTFEDGAAESTSRVRLRIRLRSKAKVGRLRLRPFVATELFVNNSGEGGVDRNRLSLGTVITFTDHVGLSLGVLRQDTRDREAVNVATGGFELKF